MKKIVILRCLRSEENCTGAACFQAVNARVMAMRKSNWWRLWPAMAAVKSLWAIAAA